MSTSPRPLAVLAAAAALAGPAILGPAIASPAVAAPDPLAAHRWADRVLLVAAPSADDPALRRQRQIFAAMGDAARERDLVLVEAVGAAPDAQALRSAFGLDPQRFAAVLVGKDGGAKLRSATPLGLDRLAPTIDAMPMRRQEMDTARRP